MIEDALGCRCCSHMAAGQQPKGLIKLMRPRGGPADKISPKTLLNRLIRSYNIKPLKSYLTVIIYHRVYQGIHSFMAHQDPLSPD